MTLCGGVTSVLIDYQFEVMLLVLQEAWHVLVMLLLQTWYVEVVVSVVTDVSLGIC